MCAGYGGIGLGLKNIFGERMRTLAYCELEGFAQANLISKMEAGLMDVAPLWNDLKTFPYESFHGLVDILIAGYPCQPFSAAGKRAGKEDPRHLWPWIADGIRLLQPRMCFFENVEGHISLGLREVVGELESMGYKVSWGIFSAREIGAPHQRKRVFILAHDKSQRVQGHGADWLQEPRPHAGQRLPLRGGDAGGGELANAGRLEPQGWCGAADGQQSGAGRIPRGEPAPRHDQVWPSRPGEPQHGWEPPRVVGNSTTEGLQGRGTVIEMDRESGGTESEGSESASSPAFASYAHGREVVGNSAEQGCQRSGRTNDPRGAIDRPTESNGGCAYGAMEQSERQTEPSLGRDLNGTSDRMDYAELSVSCDNRTDELRLLGNGVVPATAERAFRTLLNELTT